jgi:hypothetical protein
MFLQYAIRWTSIPNEIERKDPETKRYRFITENLNIESNDTSTCSYTGAADIMYGTVKLLKTGPSENQPSLNIGQLF